MFRVVFVHGEIDDLPACPPAHQLACLPATPAKHVPIPVRQYPINIIAAISKAQTACPMIPSFLLGHNMLFAPADFFTSTVRR